jgi:uncharacterized protein (TIGR02466 family)
MSLEVGVTRDITLSFAVPVMARRVPKFEDANPGLRKAILARERAGAGRSKSNAGGWQSEDTLLTWPEPEVAALKGWIDEAVRAMCELPQRGQAGKLQLAYRATGWANVNRHGHYNTTHVHAGSHWAVVYYVDTGEEEPGHSFNGQLELRDPRPAAVFGRLPGFMFGRSISIRPQPGLLVVFPAWIEHGVRPFFGTGDRISVAVNIDVTKFEIEEAGQGVAGS